MRLRSMLSAALWIAPALATASAAQEAASAPELFSQAVDVRVVNVDVHVTDKKGRPITGLTAEDFVLSHDGAPVEIRYFYAAGEEPAEAPDETETVEVGDDGSYRPPAVDDPLVVIYLDNFWLMPGDRRRILDDLERFVAEQPPGLVRFLLATHDPGLTIRSPLTRDPAAVLAALDEQRDAPTQGLLARREHQAVYEGIRAIWEEYVDSPFCPDPCTCGWEQMVGVWRDYAQNVGHRIRVASAGMQELLAALSGIPDRKAVLYVGSGFDQRPGLDVLQYLIELCPMFERDLSTYLQQYDESTLLLDLGAWANAGRATFYPLDAAGLRADASSSVDIFDARLRPSALVSQIQRSNVQAGFQILASATGGRAILDANQPFDDLVDLQQDFEHVYSLGFEPPGEPDGGTHLLRVELAERRRGARLRYRTSYVDKPLERRLVDRAIAAMAFSEQSNPLGVEAAIGAVEQLGEKVIRLPVEVKVDVGQLTLVTADDGTERGRFRVFLAARSHEGGRTTLRERFFDVTPEALAAGVQSIVVNMNLEPGAYTVGVGVRDEIGTETSYLALETDGTPAPAG